MTDYRVTLTWDDPGNESIMSYRILRRSRDGPQYGDNLGAPEFVIVEDNTGSSATTYTDYSITPGTRYVYRVVARNPTGISERSGYANADTLLPAIAGTPTGLVVSSVTNYSVTLTWDDPEDETIESYQILRRLLTDPLPIVVIEADTGSSATTYTDYSVSPGTEYVYRVRARNMHDWSENSDAVVTTTNDTPITDATLSSLMIGTKDVIGFNPDRTAYNVGVSSETTRVTITASPTSNATVSYSMNDADSEMHGHQVNLPPGLNAITITVTAEDDVTIKTYTLSIGRGTGGVSGWTAEADLDGLIGAGNTDPFGIWGNATNLWIADSAERRLYVYNKDGTRDLSSEFALLPENGAPTGVWSDGTIMWVADSDDRRLYAYQLSNGDHVFSRDIRLFADNADPAELWSDGETVWVLDSVQQWIYAYRLSDGVREPSSDMIGSTSGVPEEIPVTGLWFDETTYWTVNNHWKSFLPARDRATTRWASDREIRLPSVITDKRSLWSDGQTVWIVSSIDDKVYALSFPRHDISLSELATTPRNIAGFSSDIREYHLGVASDVDVVTIMATTTDNDATISYSSPDIDSEEDGHQVLLEPGLNIQTLTVTAQNGRSIGNTTLNIGRSVRSKHGWRAIYDLNGMLTEGNTNPVGIWGDDTTLWITDAPSDIFAYNRDGTRDTTKEFSRHPDDISIVNWSDGIWSNGETMWVADPHPGKVYAYTLANGERDTTKEFSLGADTPNPTDMWSDGTTIWVANHSPAKIVAYTLADGERDSGKDVDVSEDVGQAVGIWSDDTTLWVVDRLGNTVVAYNLDERSRTPAQDFSIPRRIGLGPKRGLWSDGNTMWMIDESNGKVFAFNFRSSVSQLRALTVHPRDIIGFEADRYSYAVGINSAVATATITATAADSNATVGFSVADADPVQNGHQVRLDAGLNTVTVSVTSEDGLFASDYTLEIGRGVTSLYGWRADFDLDGLIASGNEDPAGIAGDADGLWILDTSDKRIYRYRSDGSREVSKEIALAASNADPTGMWADTSVLYVADADADKLFAYSPQDGSRQESRDITLDTENGSPGDIWSGAGIVWVLDKDTRKIFAYLGSNGTRQSSRDLDISSATVTPTGIWSNGNIMWVAQDDTLAVTSWNLDSRTREPDSDFSLPADIGPIDKKALWAYGPLLWVTSTAKHKVYAVNFLDNDATLSSLSVNPEDIIGFLPSKYVYSVGFPSTDAVATITVVTSDSNATISYSQPDLDPDTEGHQYRLFPGLNFLTIVVTAEDNISTRQYHLLMGRGSDDGYGWKAEDDLDGLEAAGNLDPFGIWSDESNLWVVDRTYNRIFVYNRDGTRASVKDFSLDADNDKPTGIWSNGTTLWVADAKDAKLYAYVLSDGTYNSDKNIVLHTDNATPADIWSDETTMWVLDVDDAIIYAYLLSDGSRLSRKDVDVSAHNTLPTGIWSDGETIWVADDNSYPLLAWDLEDGTRQAVQDFDLQVGIGLSDKKALWSLNHTLWITSTNRFKAFAFNLPNDDTSLRALTVSPRDIIGFRSGRYSYAVGVASTVTTATVEASTTDENSTVSFSSADADTNTPGHQITLSHGANYLTITVTAEDGVSSQRYSLNIGRGGTDNYDWKAVDDADGLIPARNFAPYGLWGNNTVLYVADDITDHIYAYNRDGTRNTSKEISLDTDDYHRNVGGIWSNGTTMWAVDYASHNPRMLAYVLSDGSRDMTKEFDLDPLNYSASDIWSDNTTMWVLDTSQKKIFAYQLSERTRDESKDVDITEAILPLGLWSDGETFWVGDIAGVDLLAWDLVSGERANDRDFRIPPVTLLFNSTALWSDDTTMWVADASQSKIFSFNMPPVSQVMFSASNLTVQEGSSVTVTVTLAPNPKRDVTIPLALADVVDAVTASTDDHSAVPESLTFAEGETSMSFTFTATDDLLAEGNESIQLAFGATPHRVSPGTPESVTITIVDDDHGIVIAPAAVTVDEGDATGADYTVKLALAPTEDVTVTVSGHTGSDLTLSGLSDTGTLTFTATDWDDAQTVTVTAGHDDDLADDTVTLTHTAAGGEYDAVTAAVAVTVADDDRGILLSPAAVTVDEGDATGADYTVKLSHQPTEDVTVTVAGHAGSDLTLAGLSATATLTFTATDWDDAQTVTVTAGHDDDAADDTVTLTHTATGGGYDAVTAPLAVTVNDDETAALVVSETAVTVDEGDATGAQYTVKLAVAPTEDVTVTVSGHAGSDLTLSGLSDTNTLTFTTTDWDNAQTVGVTAAEDDDPADDTVTLTHTAAGGEYDAVTAAVAVTVNDDETAALVVSETAVTVAEGDATGADYTVKLSHQPTEDVTVTVAGHAGSDLTLAGPSATATLTFTATDWDDAQTVTVTAGHDDDGTDDTATLTHTATGGGYDAATAAVAVTVTDDDRGIVLTPAAVTVDEGDATGAQYTVKLAVAPTEDVTVTVSGHAGSDLTLSGLSDTNTLTFTTTDWDNAQTVGVTAAEDDDPADDTVTLTHTAAGGEYDAVTAAVAVTVNDDETAALVVSETAVTVAEGDATGADYTVKLSHQPTEDVTVTVAGHAGSDLTLAGPSATATLTFTATDWDDAQTVTVTAGHDDDGTDDTATLTHTATGGGYDAATAAVAVTVTDDDRGIVLTPAAVTVDEGDATGAQYTVKLAVAPTEDVTVTVSGHAGSDLTLSGLSDTNTLTFTTTDWDNAQTVGVTAAEDDDPADDTVTLTHTAAGGEYDAVTAAVAVTVNDDETAALVVSETAVTVAEGDATGADYTVKLSHQPTEDVTVTVAGHAGSDLTLAGPSATATLTFTATDWDDAQTVTVTAGHDDDGTDDTATLTHTATGGGYDAATAAVAVTVADDDRGIVLTPAAVTVDEGDATGAQYTVKLAVAPTEDVTVTVSGHAGSDLTLSGLSDTNTLTFTTTDWDNAQTVGVTAAEDDDPADDTVTLTHTAAGGEYDAVTAAVAVTVNDDETAALVVSETAVTVAEGDATGADYTVKLSHQPTEDVTVTVAGHAGSDLTLAGPSATATLTFTATDWDDAQTVTVTAGHDDDGTDDTATLTHTATGGGYDAATAAVAVTVADDDRGIVLTPAAVTVDEGDATGAQYTVKLAVAPTEDVTVTVSGHAGSDLTLSGLSDTNTLTFTTTDWDNAQTVGVTAAEDDDPADDTVTLTHTAAGGEYDAVTAAVAVTVNDDETAALVVSETAVTVAEGDATGADYTVKLSHQPTEDVTVTVAGHAGSDLTLAGPSTTATLTFTATDWDDAQTVTVTAGHDDDGTDDTATLTHTATGGGYDAATAAVAVTVTDDDRGIVLTPAAVTVDEGDATGAQYTVKLAVAPTEDVTVTVSGHAGSDLTLSGLSDTNTLTFTTTDWDNAQTVGVTAAEDDDPADDTVTLTHTAAGGEYDAVTAAVAVTVNDDDRSDLDPIVPTCDDAGRYQAENVATTNGGKELADQDANMNGNVPHLTAGGGHLEGYIAPCDDWDMFGFTLAEGKYYRIDFLGSSTRDGTLGAPNILGFFIRGPQSHWYRTSAEPVWYRHSDGKRPFTVYDSNSAPVETVWVDPGAPFQENWAPLTDGNRRGGVGDNARHYLMGFPAATYYVLLGGSGYSVGTYRISLTEVSDDDSGIRSLSVGSSVTGTLDFAGDEDTFEVVLTAGSPYEVSIAAEGPEWGVATAPFVSKVEEVQSSTVTSFLFTTKSETRFFTFTPATTGSYRFTVTGHRLPSNPDFADGEYVLTVTSLNRPASGAPVVSGVARVGETLTVDTSGVSDEDGLTNATFTYQWIASDGTTDSDIAGATGSSYVLVAGDVGKRIKVRVSFTDDTGNHESLTSQPVGPVDHQVSHQRSNAPASGALVVSGVARVGETLTVDTSGVSDEDGLTNATFTYQWIASDGTTDSDIAGATGSSYVLVAGDVGKRIKVRVSFTDDTGNHESLTSKATAAVFAALAPLTAEFLDTPKSHDGHTVFTLELRFSEQLDLGYVTLRDHAFSVIGGTVTKARRLERTSNVRWEISIRPHSNGALTVVLPATQSCTDLGAICTEDSRMLSAEVTLTVAGPEQ